MPNPHPQMLHMPNMHQPPLMPQPPPKLNSFPSPAFTQAPDPIHAPTLIHAQPRSRNPTPNPHPTQTPIPNLHAPTPNSGSTPTQAQAHLKALMIFSPMCMGAVLKHGWGLGSSPLETQAHQNRPTQTSSPKPSKPKLPSSPLQLITVIFSKA